jgi:hypothetical protein
MPLIEVQFHGIWGLYLGSGKFKLECDTVDTLMELVESKFGDSLRQKIAEHGAKLDGGIAKYSYIALNNTGLKQLNSVELKPGDVLHIFASIPGG